MERCSNGNGDWSHVGILNKQIIVLRIMGIRFFILEKGVTNIEREKGRMNIV